MAALGTQTLNGPIPTSKSTSTSTTTSKSTSTSMSTSSPNSLRSVFRRWRSRWRPESQSTSTTRIYKPMDSAPPTRPPTVDSTRPPTNTSTRPPTEKSTTPPSPSNPASPIPPHTALFTPTTFTTIHSPADPRNRSASPSPANTLRKSRRPSVSRRNTIQSESSASPPTSHPHLTSQSFSQTQLQSQSSIYAQPPYEDYTNQPLNLVTTTIVAGNAPDPRRKRSSRLRLSISRRSSAVASPLGSPVFPGQGHGLSHRSSSPSLQRLHERSSSRAHGEGGGRMRADSYREEFAEDGGKGQRGVHVHASGRSTPTPVGW